MGLSEQERAELSEEVERQWLHHMLAGGEFPK